jgi:hypothetical protein
MSIVNYVYCRTSELQIVTSTASTLSETKRENVEPSRIIQHNLMLCNRKCIADATSNEYQSKSLF